MDPIAENMKSREDMYRLLGRFYYKEADADFIRQLRGLSFSQTGSPSFDEGAKLLASAVSAIDPEGNLDGLAADYARIFLGAGVVDEVSAFPFESVYTSPKHLVAQDAYEEVYKIFEKAGLAKADRDLLEDHAALELAYMARLCAKARESAEKKDEKGLDAAVEEQAEFLQKHILNWMPGFCADIRRCPGGDFYKAASLLTEGFLGLEKEGLEESA
ncbi:molecular chaperone TorD family protein [Mesosutterella sp. AGMB02718]|uniref:Molecular chaperone TorD family protein n=1 Tax=Mesosutterella faecium TaxID=2925194 RepID=A0ABT7ISF7_9BURK|nr:molecular chaperone TorD family protein [Mesosutterella sp. AGMB02718]MDL2060212.1 molecular chaperone TorD family protein [Mesosutterella sp. AGMB02718]